jgi:hypothetical protein
MGMQHAVHRGCAYDVGYGGVKRVLDCRVPVAVHAHLHLATLLIGLVALFACVGLGVRFGCCFVQQLL